MKHYYLYIETVKKHKKGRMREFVLYRKFFILLMIFYLNNEEFLMNPLPCLNDKFFLLVL